MLAIDKIDNLETKNSGQRSLGSEVVIHYTEPILLFLFIFVMTSNRLKTWLFCLVGFLILVICPLSAQQTSHLHQRAVISKKENWKQGQINDIRHVIDSFFYDNGQVREVAESIIKREKFKVVDSIPVNKRMVWDSEANLILLEEFQNGQVTKLHNHYPANQNIVPNGSFEQHANIPKHIITGYTEVDFSKINMHIKHKKIIHQKINDFDTILHVLHTDTLMQNDLYDDTDPFGSWLNKYVVLKSSNAVFDTIHLKRMSRLKVIQNHNTHQYSKDAFHHLCNYDYKEIESGGVRAKGWESVGQKGLKVYDFEARSPEHPLTYLADYVFSFKPIAGNSFAKIQSSYWQNSECSLNASHPLLQSTLNTTLEKTKSYTLEFWLWKPNDYSSDKQFFVCFTQEPVTWRNYREYLQNAFLVDAFNDTTYACWQKVSLNFLPHENARYMTLGFFDYKLGWKNTIATGNSADYKFCWCYVDGFVLGETAQMKNINPNFGTDGGNDFTDNKRLQTNNNIVLDGKELDLNVPLVFDNVNFKTNDYSLNDSAKVQLDKLVDIMTSHPSIYLAVEGHTDNEGKDDYNLILSLKRAQTIVGYLCSKGIESARLTARGYGNTKPIATNVNENGRRKNRRVEFIFTRTLIPRSAHRPCHRAGKPATLLLSGFRSPHCKWRTHFSI